MTLVAVTSRVWFNLCNHCKGLFTYETTASKSSSSDVAWSISLITRAKPMGDSRSCHGLRRCALSRAENTTPTQRMRMAPNP